MARFDVRAQEHAWSVNPQTLVVPSFLPVGTATSLDGGYRLSGRWCFGSGRTHAQWALSGARITGAAPSSGWLALTRER
jgi:3-hydroxy-9,10-secoandrosta-1,3,5(10)-triene-9,17-dione monooxygenase